MKNSLRIFAFLFVAFISVSSAFSATWDGGGSDNFASTKENWTENIFPPYGDIIIFDATSSEDCTWDLNETYASLTIDGAYIGAITLNSTLTLSAPYPVIVVPYNASAQSVTVDQTTEVSKADVFFLMDSTGSMGGEISNLRASLNTIIINLDASVSDIAFGLGEYRDFPTGTYGSAGDQPFSLRHRIMTANTPAGFSSIQTTANALTASGGNDLPESGWEAIYQIAAGTGTTAGSALVPAFNSATAYPTSPPSGETVGDLGGAGFRQGSLPIVVWMTDAHNHNSEAFADDYYSFYGAAFRASALSETAGFGMRIIGLVSQDFDYASAAADMAYGVSATHAIVPPNAWGVPEVDRPSGCATDQCCTGLASAGAATNADGLCPLTFTISNDGTGLGIALVSAVKAYISYGSFDVSAAIIDDPSDSIDVAATFVNRIVTYVSAGGPCANGFTALDTDADTYTDTFLDVPVGSTVCFEIVPNNNTSIAATADPQTFKGSLVLLGEGHTELARRDVYFVVPPAD